LTRVTPKDSRKNTRRKANAPPQSEPRPQQRPELGQKQKPRSPEPGGGGFYGFHVVREILRARRRKLGTLYATTAAAEKLQAEIAEAGLVAQIVDASDLSRRLGEGAVHQGVLLEAGPLAPLDLADITSRSGMILVLDQITDPHNVGAILRSCAAYDVDALVTTERHTPDLTGLVAKAASGGLEHVPIVSIVNLARALEHLGDLGYTRIGLDSEAPTCLEDVAAARPLALVLGAEGKGLRRLTREKCDYLARLDMPGPIKSLNVSNACAVALTLVYARRP
jgi:23S rRNA (guanosine2251-2'-O)-methyltransferase